MSQVHKENFTDLLTEVEELQDGDQHTSFQPYMQVTKLRPSHLEPPFDKYNQIPQ